MLISFAVLGCILWCIKSPFYTVDHSKLCRCVLERFLLAV